MDNIIQAFTQVFTKISTSFQAMYVAYVFEFLIAFICVFLVLNLLSRNNASIISVLLVFYLIAISIIAISTQMLPEIYMVLISLFILGIVGIFAPEIKRSIWAVKRGKTQHGELVHQSKESVQKVNDNINEIIKALQNMSKNDVGAILVLCNTKVPDNILNSGVKLEANISSSLIESVFFPKTPLHDGAMIIQGNKIVSAGCFLPLSQETDLPKDLGTRHRAGIGITETINATSIIVSEETGIISIAKAGKITRYADSAKLKEELRKFYWQDLFGQKWGVNYAKTKTKNRINIIKNRRIANTCWNYFYYNKFFNLNENRI